LAAPKGFWHIRRLHLRGVYENFLALIMIIGDVSNHRDREEGAIIYPVYSRRSAGLSIGVNLFPDRKLCSFDCPYCEVFPFETDIVFTMETMKSALGRAILQARKNKIPVKDICFSGNGEPTMSPYFEEAITAAAATRTEQAPEAKVVVITNGTGLLNPAMFEFLKTAALSAMGLHIWLKLDAATEAWYRAMDRSQVPRAELLSRIVDFAKSGAPFTIQTMLCTIKGALPSQEESEAWIQQVTELAVLSAAGANTDADVNTGATERQAALRAVQLYGKARPAPEDPLAEAAPAVLLENRAALLRLALEKAGIQLPVEVYP